MRTLGRMIAVIAVLLAMPGVTPVRPAAAMGFPMVPPPLWDVAPAWTVDGLIAAMRDPDPDVRAEAVRFGGFYRVWPVAKERASEVAPQILQAMIEGSRKELDGAGLLALFELGVPQLIFGHAESSLRARALERLPAEGAHAGWKEEQRVVILSRFADSEPAVRLAALRALVRIGVEDQRPAIEALLEDRDAEVRDAAAAAIAELDKMTATPAEPIEVLVARLDSADAEERAGAISALAAHAATAQASVIAALLDDPVPLVRMTAIEALAALDARDQAGAVASRLADHNYAVRVAAVGAVAKLASSQHTTTIVGLLGDPTDEVRAAAVDALAASGNRDLVAPFAALLDDPGPRVRRAVVQALGKSGDPALVIPIAARLADYAADVRTAAVEALVALDARDQAGAVAVRLDDPDARVAIAAVEALRAWRGGENVPLIAQRLCRFRSYPIADAPLIDLMRQSGVTDLATPFLDCLDDADPGARAYALDALRSLGVPEWPARASALLADPSPEVRQAAARALGSAGRDAADRVAPLLRDPAPLVRLAAIEALVALGASDRADEIAALLLDEEEAVDEPRTECELGKSTYWVLYRKRQAEADAVLAATCYSSERPVWDVRIGAHAARALADLGAKEQAAAIAALLRYRPRHGWSYSEGFHELEPTATWSILALGPHPPEMISTVLMQAGRFPAANLRLIVLAHVLGRGTPEAEALIREHRE
jgi:HEAT repeat protein